MANAEPKVCDFIIFSDGIIREEGTGKLSFIGSFQHFNAPGFPLRVTGMFATVAFTNVRQKVERFHLAMRIEDAKSGHAVTSGMIEIGFTEVPSQEDVIEVPFRFPSFQFPSAGLYKVIFLIDNEVVGSRYLPVRSITAVAKT